MFPQLTEIEARVIGCLLEKEVTTPEQYPLSRNALTLACNQKSSRTPVMTLSENEVQQAIDQLMSKRLLSEQGGGRVARYQHRFCNTQFSDLQFSTAQTALICVLLLRGAQTLGELKTRCQRLYDFQSINEVEAQLQQLMICEPPVIKQLAKEVGKREVRYCELFSPVKDLLSNTVLETSQTQETLESYRLKVAALEEKVALLEAELAQLKSS